MSSHPREEVDTLGGVWGCLLCMQGAEKVYQKMLQEKINYIISGIIEFQLLKRKDEKLSGFMHEGIRLEKVFYYSRSHCTARAKQKKFE